LKENLSQIKDKFMGYIERLVEDDLVARIRYSSGTVKGSDLLIGSNKNWL
jgi:hypothetical protein